ncbi:MAG TPA: glycosyltransferase family 4 protein, partial [Elusimicrobiales bacterium]|nr:glycosyltransferase family 4 protein [Elusimicrobiales bacterium]
PNNELPDELRSADVYVSTSLSDAGIASSTAEAMSCGLPVVVSDSGENRLWVNDGANGYVVPVRNPKELADKLILLLQDRDLRIKMGQANRKVIKERDDYYREMDKMDKLYLAIAKKVL